MWKRLLPFATLLASVTIAIPAFAEVILQEFCRQGGCYQTKFIRKVASEQSVTGTFYTIETASRNWKDTAQPTNNWSEPRVSYANCSTTQPAYIFISGENYVVHLLNPGNRFDPSFIQASQEMYWVICHNFVGPFRSPNTSMPEHARRLGYPLNREIDQLELSSEAELRDFFGISQHESNQSNISSIEIGTRYLIRELPPSIEFLHSSVVGDVFVYPSFWISLVQQEEQESLWFSIGIGHQGQQGIFELIDTADSPELKPGQSFAIMGCTYNDIPDPEIYAIVRYTDTEYWTQIVQAWRANRRTWQIEPISTEGIRCYNRSWGV